jgi:predicted metallopeptidase
MKFDFKKIGILLLIIGLVTVAILAVTSNSEEKYFNQIELPTTNSIVNSLDNIHYYDTILAVGMDGVGLNGVTVVINDMSDAAKKQFNGELKAHIRLHNGIYYLFVGALNKSEAIEVLSHEIIHILQYESGELVYENGEVVWQNEVYTLEEEYERRPWEREAFSRQSVVESIILDRLY